jgi:hypothetical protein
MQWKPGRGALYFCLTLHFFKVLSPSVDDRDCGKAWLSAEFILRESLVLAGGGNSLRETIDSQISRYGPQQNPVDYEGSVLPREMESNCEERIAEQIRSRAHASTRAERHSTFPKDLMIKLTAVSRI